MDLVKKIAKKEWRKEPYRFQNWGNWLHRMSAYVGKIKPSMAHLLIKYASNKEDVILDPFCGVGTVLLEADFLGRKSIGVDLSPYAFCISQAKFNRVHIDKHFKWLDNISLDLSSVNLNSCSPFMRQFYHYKTLKEILVVLELIKKEKKYFLLGCLLGIIHGHRPGHLSATTSLVIPYNPRTKPEYREVIPRLKSKVLRMYQDGFNLKSNCQIFNADSRDLPIHENSVDLVVSSPPYFNTLDYVNDNRLRLEFLGYSKDGRNKLKKELIQNKMNYLDDMKRVGHELNRVIKPNGLCIFILGDLHSGNTIINTAQEVKSIYEKIGFSSLGVVEDSMPKNKAIPSKIKRNKSDRILILKNT